MPDTAPATFQVLVSSFNSQGIEVYRGDTPVAFGQTSAVVTLVLLTGLVPVPATPANLQQTTFNFADGTIFGLANIPVTLATGTFVGDVGDFALTGNGLVASGSVVIGSCTFLVTTSTFPAGQGLQVGDQIVLDPCQVDAIDRRLIATNAIIRLTAASSPPVVIPPDTMLNLPPSTHPGHCWGHSWRSPDRGCRERYADGGHRARHHGPPGAWDSNAHQHRGGDLTSP